MGDLEPQVKRPGAVPHEHHHRDFQRPLADVSGRVDQAQVGVVDGQLGEFGLRVEQFDGLHLDREFGGLLQLGQLFLDASSLLPSGLRRMDRAVAAPRGPVAARGHVEDQNRLDAQRGAPRERLVAGYRLSGCGPGAVPGHGQSSQRHSRRTDTLQEVPARPPAHRWWLRAGTAPTASFLADDVQSVVLICLGHRQFLSLIGATQVPGCGLNGDGSSVATNQFNRNAIGVRGVGAALVRCEPRRVLNARRHRRPRARRWRCG